MYTFTYKVLYQGTTTSSILSMLPDDNPPYLVLEG